MHSHSDRQPPRRLSTADHAAMELQLNQWKELNQQRSSHPPRHRSPTQPSQSLESIDSHPTTPKPEHSSTRDPPFELDHDAEPLTPFLIDAAQFAQQDIFDLPTFAHLAAETAAEYARRPLHSFPPPPPHSHSLNGLNAHLPEIPPSQLIYSARARSDEDSHFQRIVREMHAEEVKRLVRGDASLRAIQRQIDSYRQEKSWLEKSHERKLKNLQLEYDQLKKRNEKLHHLTDKIHANEERLKSMTGFGLNASSPSYSTSSRRRQLSVGSSSGISSAASSQQSSQQVSPITSPVSDVRQHPLRQ